jgi:uncharacterized protein (TIRG00374 family)
MKTVNSKAKFKAQLMNKMKHNGILFLKFAFVVGLLYFLAKKGFISVQATQDALKQWQIILPAAVTLFLTSGLGIVRWQLLLRAQNIHLSWVKVFQLTFIGNFFNIAIPGAVSGDFVKAFYIGKELKGEKSRAFGSILFDRVAGLSALIVVSAGALALGLQSFLHSPLLQAIQFIVTVGAVTVIAFYAYLFLVREHHDPLLRAFRTVQKKIPKASALTRIYESLRHYHNHRVTVLKVLALSALIHLSVGWACLQFAQALGEAQLSLLSLYVVVPLGLLVTAVPVAPAGVGTGNIAFLYFFHLLGSERGADVFSLYAMSQILFSSLGGIIYFRFKAGNEMGEMNAVPSPAK